MRPLGISVMRCRAMQALHLLAVKPIEETARDPNSYGFRPERATADAEAQYFIVLAKKPSAQWVVDSFFTTTEDGMGMGSAHPPLDHRSPRRAHRGGE